MKTMHKPLVAALLIVGLAGCNKNNANEPAGAANETGSALSDFGNSAANAAGAAADIVTPTPSGQEFADKAAKSDAFEIAAGKLAATNGASPKVKAFAAEMIKAHTASTDKIKAAAHKATAAITPDPTLTEDQKEKLDKLGKLTGAEFDREYLSGQVDAHEDALSLMRDYAKHGDVPSLKAAAGEIAPIVQKHLDEVKALKG